MLMSSKRVGFLPTESEAHRSHLELTKRARNERIKLLMLILINLRFSKIVYNGNIYLATHTEGFPPAGSPRR